MPLLSTRRTLLSVLGLSAAVSVAWFPAGSFALAQESGRRQETGTLAEAVQLIQRRDFDGAVAILERITESEPENPRAWALLGYSLHARGDLERAIAAHLKAAEFDQTAPTAMYNAGLAYALKGEPDSAFVWLFRARDTGRINMTSIALDPDSESLHDDPRYRQLFPTAGEFEDPFVEPARVIHEWRGESAGDAFGWIARVVGDVDGDGIDDLTTSAPNHVSEDTQAGKVYVFSGASGDLLWERVGRPGERLGLGIEAAGDVNADGVPDVVAGAPGGDRAYVFSGRDSEVLLDLPALQEGELFGRKVTDIGDVDADGHDDILVGAPQNDVAGEDAGRAYLFSGRYGNVLLTLTGERAGDAFGISVGGYKDDRHLFLVVSASRAGAKRAGRVYVYRDLGGSPAFVIEADDSGNALGANFVSVVGDVDADGVPDIYASDWSNTAKGRNTGRIYVHSGADGRRIHTLTGEAAGDGFGIGPADAGDVNGDGHADLVIGAWQHAGAAPSGGKVYLFSGKDASLLGTLTGKVPGETLGFDATGMGDVDGDGVADLLLTSAWSAINGARSGRMYVISGNLGAPGERR